MFIYIYSQLTAHTRLYVSVVSVRLCVSMNMYNYSHLIYAMPSCYKPSRTIAQSGSQCTQGSPSPRCIPETSRASTRPSGIRKPPPGRPWISPPLQPWQARERPIGWRPIRRTSMEERRPLDPSRLQISLRVGRSLWLEARSLLGVCPAIGITFFLFVLVFSLILSLGSCSSYFLLSSSLFFCARSFTPLLLGPLCFLLFYLFIIYSANPLYLTKSEILSLQPHLKFSFCVDFRHSPSSRSLFLSNMRVSL